MGSCKCRALKLKFFLISFTIDQLHASTISRAGKNNAVNHTLFKFQSGSDIAQVQSGLGSIILPGVPKEESWEYLVNNSNNYYNNQGTEAGERHDLNAWSYYF